MQKRTIYNKLVRDRIPEIIRENDQDCYIEILSDEDYIQALHDKLIEEANEAANAEGDDLVKELADLYEVMNALMVVMQIKPDEIQERRKQRRLNRGGFEKKIRLVWSTNPTEQQ